MSAGLMSCVRENSPPLEMASSDGRTESFSSSTHEPQKRRRFHPLRNLRRIFRRRSVAHADTVTPTITPTGTTSSPSSTTSTTHAPHYYLNATSTQQYNYPDDCDITNYDDTTIRTVIYSPANIIDINKCNSGSSDGLIKLHDNQQIYTRDYYIKGDKREHSANSVRKKDLIDDLEHAVAGCDMTDCQRSLSEGRLVDSDLSRDAFSQSHDSVFSESATASSLSIVLKAELVDALRKRRNRTNAFDEDLGLPHSPTTLHNISKNHMLQHINQSDKSLSYLSITSSDFDDESMLNISDFSLQNKMSIDTSRTSSDSTDGSIGSKLSHSAARHKMAIRPKKKGPSRHRPIEQKPLPSTPEVTEEVNRASTPLSMSNPIKATKPPLQAISKSISTTLASKSVDHYINTTLECSKLTEETIPVSPSSVTVLSTANCNLVKSNSENHSQKLVTKLQFNSVVSHEDAGDAIEKEGIEKSSGDNLSKQSSMEKKTKILETSTNTLPKEYDSKVNDKILIETKPYDSKKFNKELRTGPASRQRILPLDKNYSPESTKKVVDTDSVGNISSTSPVLTRKHQKISRSEEILIPKNVNKELLSEFPRSVSPPKSNWHGQHQAVIREESLSSFEQQKVHLPKIYGLNSPVQNITTAPIYNKSLTSSNNSLPTSPISNDANFNISKTFNNKSVEKSKSFRAANYTNKDNTIKNINLPSLPDLTNNNTNIIINNNNNNNTNNSNNNNINANNKQNNNEQNLLKLKFEINDNNLVNKYQKITDNNDNNIKRNIFTTNEYTSIGKINKLPQLNIGGSIDNSINNNNTNNNNTKNITEIEEKIDILVKSSFTTILKKKEEIIEDCKNNNNVSITTIIPPMTSIITTPVSSPPVITTSAITANDFIDKKSPVIQHDNKKIPEFMKFTLNRADSIPPIKSSNIIITNNNNNNNNLLQNIKNITNSNNNNNNNEIMKIRRFSNENIEINETKQQPQTPTTPTDNIHDNNNLKRNNINHQQQSSPFKNKIFNNNDNKLISDYRKLVADEKLKIERRLSTTTASSPVIPITIALLTTTAATVTTTITTGSTLITTSTHADILNNNNNNISKTAAIDDDNCVVLRKKSITPSTKKDDQPELMKVFARRSLKIKDSDSIQDDLINVNSNIINNNNNNIKAINNMDSDKENQSSSEEKLDKITKNENNNKIIITDNEINDKYLHQEKQLQQQQQHHHQQHINVPTSIIGVTTPIKKFINTNIITPKPFVAPSRFGNVSNFRNVSAVQATMTPITTVVPSVTTPTSTPTTPQPQTIPTTFLDIKKNLYQNPTTQQIGIASLITNNNNNNNNNLVNETTTITTSAPTIIPTAKQQINKTTTTAAANNLINARHTINVPTQFIVNPIMKNERPVTMSATTTVSPTSNILSTRTNDKQEFKGILQRRAEWEKRAKETFK